MNDAYVEKLQEELAESERKVARLRKSLRSVIEAIEEGAIFSYLEDTLTPQLYAALRDTA